MAFIAGQFDMTFPYEVTVPNMKDIKSQMPDAICEITPTNFAPASTAGPMDEHVTKI